MNRKRQPFTFRKLTFYASKGKLSHAKRRPFITHWLSNRYKTYCKQHERKPEPAAKKARDNGRGGGSTSGGGINRVRKQIFHFLKELYCPISVFS